MYSCVFVKYLWKDLDKKRLFKTLEKKANLPFCPAIGLEVSEGDWYSGIIERVVWDNFEKVFTIKVLDITPKEGVTAELLLDVAVKQGWGSRG